MIDLTKEVWATDASQALGFSERNAVAKMCKNGKVPGARQNKSGRWMVPRWWLERELIEREKPVKKRGRGKPRGFKHG